jgi:putative transposase
VTNDGMQLSPLGKIVQTEWFRSAEIRKEIRLFEDEFVVMPNHLHGIVWIVENEIVGADGVRPGVRPGVCPDIPSIVHPGLRPGEQPCTTNSGARREEGACHAPLRRAPRSLSSFIAGFKAAVTSRAGRELNAANIWQRNYYEHIVRSENELKNIWNYIDTNPLRWQEDQLHPSALPNRFNQDNP